MVRAIIIAVSLLILNTQAGITQERRDIPAPRTLGTPATFQDAKAIDALLATYKKAWSSQNTALLMSIHASDTEWINAYARLFQGTNSLGNFIENRLFPNFPIDISRAEMNNMQLISRRYIGNNAAVLHFYTDGNRGPSRNKEEANRRTHMHLVLEKKDQQWLIVHTAIMDAR